MSFVTKKISTNEDMLKKIYWIILLWLCFFILAACQNADVMENEYERVKLQIDEAKEIEAEKFSGRELFLAEKKLKEAEKLHKKNNKKSLMLLREANLHAKLSEERARRMIREKSLLELNKGLDTLKKEVN